MRTKPVRPLLRVGRGFSRYRQNGIVLIMALILLVIISMTAVLAVKGAMSGEQVSNNLRVGAVAAQNAEVGLRYCENLVMAGSAPVLLLPDDITMTPTRWATRSNWTTTNIITVPSGVADSSDSAGRTMATPAICMVEAMKVPILNTTGLSANYLITSRGFSQDYRTASNGSVLAGSEVWMQSVLRY